MLSTLLSYNGRISAELNSCDRDHLACKAKNIYYLDIDRKKLHSLEVSWYSMDLESSSIPICYCKELMHIK